MDSDAGRTLMPPQGRGSAGPCETCDALVPGANQLDRTVTENDNVVVLSAADRDGFVVVPRLHVSGLEELSAGSRAGVLAAVRRALNTVREENPWSTGHIMVVTASPAAEGHLCIRVRP